MTWFRHDTSAHLDEKMIVLRKRHGWEAEGVYWLLVSLCYEDDGKIEAYKLPIIFEANDIPHGEAIFSTMVELRLFVLNDRLNCYESKRVSAELAKENEWRKLRSEAGRAGGQASAEARKKAKNPTTVEQPSSTRQRSSTISTTDRTIPTIPNQAREKNESSRTTKIDDRKILSLSELEPKFKEFATDLTDPAYADKTWDQGSALRGQDREEFTRKVRVMVNSATHESTAPLAKKIFHEIAGFVNDRGAMQSRLTTQEAEARRLFKEETGQEIDEA